jgi:hypothetical protein
VSFRTGVAISAPISQTNRRRLSGCSLGRPCVFCTGPRGFFIPRTLTRKWWFLPMFSHKRRFLPSGWFRLPAHRALRLAPPLAEATLRLRPSQYTQWVSGLQNDSASALQEDHWPGGSFLEKSDYFRLLLHCVLGCESIALQGQQNEHLRKNSRGWVAGTTPLRSGSSGPGNNLGGLAPRHPSA